MGLGTSGQFLEDVTRERQNGEEKWVCGCAWVCTPERSGWDLADVWVDGWVGTRLGRGDDEESILSP